MTFEADRALISAGSGYDELRIQQSQGLQMRESIARTHISRTVLDFSLSGPFA